MQEDTQAESVEQNAEPEVVVEAPVEAPSEIETLRARANQMGLKFHPATGVDKLRAKIEAKLNGDTQGVSQKQIKNLTTKAGKTNTKVQPLTHAQFKVERAEQIRKSINSLIRIRVTCMNPNKSEWEGEIISVGSAKLGTFKKYVPFNTADGWHVPQIIYEAMKERKYTQFFNARGPRGEKIRKGKLMPEFSIDVLPPLTTAELRQLAQRQAMSRQA